MTRKLAVSVVVLFALAVALAGADLYFTNTQVGKLQTALRASCASAADIGQAPVAVDPVTGKASVLGVKLVSDFRAQWRTLGCPGQLPPPRPSFVKWARYYHLPAS